MSEIKKAIRRWKAEGWDVTMTKNHHWKLKHPDADGLIFTSSTPSDHRSLTNIEAQMRRKLRDNALQT